MSFQRPQRGPLRRSFWTRLYFVWAVTWAALVTVPLSVGMLVHNALHPSPRTFKLWLTLWGRAILFGAGIRLRTVVRTDIPESEPVVFVANHQNMIDIVTCGAGIPHSYGFIAKSALRRMPFIGAVIARSSSVFVDRSTPRRAAESIKEAAAVIRNGNSVLVYVEGERSYGRDLLPLLRGAFVLAVEAGVPLVPVAILDNFEVIDERRRAARPGRTHMVIAPPIPTRGRPRSDIPALMDQVRRSIEAELELFHGSALETGATSDVSFGPSPLTPHERHPG